LLIYSYFTIPGGRVGSQAAGRVLDIPKIQLTQPSLVELGLGLSLAKTSFESCGWQNLVCSHFSKGQKLHLIMSFWDSDGNFFETMKFICIALQQG
jgi:hypothetical protein